MIGAHLILWTLWLLYCFLHSALASTCVKQRIREPFKLSDKSYRLAYNIFALVALVILIYYQTEMESTLLLPKGGVLTSVAIIFVASGLSIMLVCIIKYFRQLSGIDKSITEKLEITGLHGFVRHPLYLGTFIFLTGSFFFFPLLSNGVTISIIIIYTVIGINFEEKKLIDKFGPAYREYQDSIPMILPRIRRSKTFKNKQ